MVHTDLKQPEERLIDELQKKYPEVVKIPARGPSLVSRSPEGVKAAMTRNLKKKSSDLQ